MLQRAANNAYSWWWASHIRTKQSKWLEQSLIDMEEKTQYVLGLIQEDGDSFAKRAEMYYKRRPELISCVEESYRAFRALAERYDHISRELQKANNSLATCSPERLQMSMNEDDDPGTPTVPQFPVQVPPSNPSNVPKVPNVPFKSLKVASKKFQITEFSKASDSDNANKSGLNKREALDEIDKLQKDILGLQTVKEFVKSSYQNGLKKFNDIENTITENQLRVSKLQDEFGVTKVIEDDEARKLMAEAALRSCQETLSQLQETQQKSAREANDEGEKIEDARQRINSIKHQYLPESEKDVLIKTEAKQPEKDESIIAGKAEQLQEKIQLQFDVSSMSSIKVTELAEKIDELVSTVFNLEDSVSSQRVLIERLRSEAYDLQANIQTLEDDKSNLNKGAHGLTNKVKELEDKLSGLQDLKKNAESQSSNLETHFGGVQSILNNLSEKLTSVQPDDDEEEATTPSQRNEKSLQDINTLQEDHEVHTSIDSIGIDNPFETGDVNAHERTNGQNGEAESPTMKTDTSVDPKMENSIEDQVSTVSELSPGIKDSNEGKDIDETNWKLLSGDEDKQKNMMREFATMLKNYKEVKKKLSDIENKNIDGQNDNPMQMEELKYAIGKRDEEIHKLRRKLNEKEGNLGENQDESSISDPSDYKKTGDDDDDDFSFILPGKSEHISQTEEQLRADIDSILDENLDFWLRFSTALNQVQKYRTTVDDLQGEITLIREKKQREDNDVDVRSEIRPIYNHMKEIRAELATWLKNSASLNEELERRLSSLCSIQEKISVALKESVAEYNIIFSSHQAAKFQGEVLNMKQENNRVKEELYAGFAHMKKLKGEVDRTLTKMIDEYSLSDYQTPLGARSKIPLQLFIFGSKVKYKRQSIFSRMQQNMKHQALKAGLPP